MSHYETLNVSREASQDDIKKSYRSLVKQHHPDKNGGDDTQFKKISLAYEVIGDPIKRKQYDATNFKGSRRKAYNNDYDFSDVWQDIFNRNDWSSMFDQSYGSQVKGEDVRVSINITVEEVYQGTRRYINVLNDGFNINIPKGIVNGTKLKIKGRGQSHAINKSAPRGDLILTVNVLPDANLIINGNDIYVDLYLDWIDLLLGGEFEVKTKVHVVKIKVPQGSHDSKTLRVVGKGMPIYKTEESGNLMVKLRTNHINLSDSEINTLKKIKESNG